MRWIRPLVAVAVAVTMVGGSAFAATAPKTSATSKTLYLSQFGCGTTAEDPYLLPTVQTDSSGCGTVGGLPLDEVEAMTGATLADLGTPYASTKKMLPFKLDGAKKITGQLTADSWIGAGGGIGTVTWDYSLTGVTTKSKTFDFGSYTVDSAVSPAGSKVETPFSIAVPKPASGLIFKSFVFTVWLHGLNVPFSAMGLAGESYIVFPAKK
ncbi:MAG: hypothetical protein JWM40_652 [Frankiales bacterium]|nr:hypothetical protein [Frankiales bacterium]